MKRLKRRYRTSCKLLNKPYFHYLCDTIVPESLQQNGIAVQLTHRLSKPRVIDEELYRVVEDGRLGIATWNASRYPDMMFSPKKISMIGNV